MRAKRRFLALLLLPAWLVFPNAFAAQALLGVLEEAPFPPDAATLATHVRAAFRKEASGWEPACAPKASPPWSASCAVPEAGDALQWTVLHGGRAIGTVTTRGWVSNEWYAAQGLLRLTSPSPPRVGARSREYAGWPGRAVFRPLAAIHGAASQGRSTWHRIGLARADEKRVFEAFSELVPRIPSCRRDASGKPIGRARPIRRGDVAPIEAFASDDGRKLVGLRVDRKLAEACYESGGFASDAWFVWSPGGRARPLPGRRDEGWPESTRPIEIGDFDSDGEEEALFRFSGYNEDGYLVFDSGFTRVRRIGWGYH